MGRGEITRLAQALSRPLSGTIDKSVVNETALVAATAVREALSPKWFSQQRERPTLSSLRVGVLGALGVLSPTYEYHPLTRRIREKVDEAIAGSLDDWNRQSPPEQDARVSQSGERSFRREVRRAGESLELPFLARIGSFGGGRSGSPVLKVEYREHGSGNRIGVLKLVDNREELLQEKSAHGKARRSWLRQHCAPEPRCPTILETDPGPHPLLSSLAFPPTAETSKVRSLHDLIVEGRRDATAIAKLLGHAYAKEFQRAVVAAGSSAREGEFLSGILEQWPSACRECAWKGTYYWHEAHLPSASVRCVLESRRLLWNPLYLLRHPELFGPEKAFFATIFQHGDLNTENILVGHSGGSPQVQLIDFEKSNARSAVLDLCWLGLWALRSSHRSTSPSVDQWNCLPAAIASALRTGAEPKRDLGNFALGLTFLQDLLADLLAVPGREKDRHEAGVLERRISQQLDLTMAAAALAMAFYEVRTLVRLQDAAPEQYEEERVRFQMAWAITFYRVAACCLAGHVDVSAHGGIPVDLDQSLRKVSSV